MSEPSAWGRPRSGRGTPRRRTGSDDDGGQQQQPPPQQHLQQQPSRDNDDLMEESRFGTMSASSWEGSSHSFDSEEASRHRPSSSLRDRRKQFDTTTPTLIDEEDEEEEMVLSLEQSALQGFGEPSAGTVAARRTPGANTSSSMYKTAFAFDEAEMASLRKTPGASAMQLAGTPVGADNVGLGYALTLSSPVAAGEDKTLGKSAAALQVEGGLEQRHMSQQKQQVRPPLAPAWLGDRERGSTGLSPRPFSPGLQRLTEDIGNLLHEDEEDDYALEIPTTFRDSAAQFGDDWTGSFDTNSTLARKTVPRVAQGTSGKEKSRRNRSATTGSAFPNAQQPKPRRNANDLFEFGMAQDRRSPQFLNFGGAFAPPVQSSLQPHVFSARPPSQQSQSQPDPSGFALSGAGSQGLFSSQSFDSHQSRNTAASPIDPFFQPYRFSSPSPTVPAPAAFRSSSPQSDMQATAMEFVPMATRATPSPHFAANLQWAHAHVPMHLGHQPHHHISYDRPPQDRNSWHSNPSSYAPFGGSYGFVAGMQSPIIGDPRSAMTPSPHFVSQSWVQPVGSVPYAAASSSTHVATARPPNDPAKASSFPHGVTNAGSASFGVVGHAGASLSLGATPEASQPLKRDRKKKHKKRTVPQKVEEQTATVSSPSTVNISAPGKKSVLSSTSSTPTKLKKKLEPRPGSATDGQGEDQVSASDDLFDLKRGELEESPSTRLTFKTFYKNYRAEERFGLQRAEDFARQALQDGSLPESVHWRVYVELADIARRSNRFVEARRLYHTVCQLQPYASQGWIEYSKLEEECGHMNRVANILNAGLEYCEFNENLLIRALKHHEKMGNYDHARALLARLKQVGIDKVWRSILEGATFEARCGNIITARRVLKHIMHYVPWYGPLYVEFYRLERDYGNASDALSVVERGLAQIPRYGPLWFAALRLCEELDFANKDYLLPETCAMLQRANLNVSKEISWKVHLEASFIFERAAQEQALLTGNPVDGFLGSARHYFALTIGSCRLNLRWKVWLAAARMELYAGKTEIARTLFRRAHEVAPEKVQSLTFLDFARLHEFIGETEIARALLCKGRYYYGYDWKVWLENVLLEMRGFNHKKAFEITKKALDVHPGTGRLWSALVQLSHFVGGDESQHAALRDALNAVPKSGEVWCEGARIHLNPFSDLFDIDRARRHLFFAEKFTPQYGDTFLEAVRLELIDQWMGPIAEYIWESTRKSFSPTKTSQDVDCLTKYITDVTLAVSCARQATAESRKFPSLVHKVIIKNVRSRLWQEDITSTVDFSSIVLSCSNADPNYGPLWFNCRRVQTDPPRRVVEHAASAMAEELRSHAHVYLAAMVRRRAILSTIEAERPLGVERGLELFNAISMGWEDRVDKLLRSFPSLRDIFNPMDPTTGLVLLQSTINGSDFVTGLMDFNRHRQITEMSLSDRRRAIFATDALFP